MLSACTVALANSSSCATVLGRNQDRLEVIKLLVHCSENLHTTVVDYQEPAQLQQALKESVSARGEFDLVVIWMHDEPAVIHQLLKPFLGSASTRCHVVWVLGSAAADPTQSYQPILTCNDNSIITEVILGFKVTDNGSRWLTRSEICQGVIYAVINGLSRHIVGVVEPWSAHP